MCACTGAVAAAPFIGGAHALRGLVAGVLGVGGIAAASDAAGAVGEKRTNLTPQQALARLTGGNDAFLADRLPPQPTNRQRRLAIAKSQTPFAVLVSCSDSRVPPEALFGQGLGDMFIVRVAGNSVSQEGLGSIEYAIAELGVPLVVVMGHERCGAVAAAVSVVEKGATFPGSIGRMIEPIVPAVLDARRRGAADLLDASVRMNVSRTVGRLRDFSEPMILDRIRSGRLRVVGARYDLDDGSVDFFDEGPVRPRT
ncbi:MAG: carbonic anhydrase [Pseudomonadota bacterium]|nr:carbonic anhydrase [Pseudomonadota bacterium]